MPSGETSQTINIFRRLIRLMLMGSFAFGTRWCYRVSMQIQEQQMVVLLKGSLTDMKRARESLDGSGISAEIVRPPGCSTSS